MMKKLIYLLFAVLFTVWACGKNDPAEKEEDKTEVENPDDKDPEETDFPVSTAQNNRLIIEGEPEITLTQVDVFNPLYLGDFSYAWLFVADTKHENKITLTLGEYPNADQTLDLTNPPNTASGKFGLAIEYKGGGWINKWWSLDVTESHKLYVKTNEDGSKTIYANGVLLRGESHSADSPFYRENQKRFSFKFTIPADFTPREGNIPIYVPLGG